MTREKRLEALLRDTVRYIDDDTTTPGMMARLAIRINAALAEPAPAQDEREGAHNLIRFDFINADGQPDSKMITHDEMRKRYATVSPEQTEQQPFGYVIAKCDPSRDGYTCTVNPVQEGKYQRPVYTTPIAQTEQQPVEVVAWANPVDLEELKISSRTIARYVIGSKSGAANVPLVRQSDHLAALLAALSTTQPGGPK